MTTFLASYVNLSNLFAASSSGNSMASDSKMSPSRKSAERSGELHESKDFANKNLKKQRDIRKTFEKTLQKVTGMHSENVVDLARCRDEEFSEMLVRSVKDPEAFQSRIWIFLEIPTSSDVALCWRVVLIILILGSIFLMFSESMPSLSVYGESSSICETVVELYCDGKGDPALDPGCFVLNSHGIPTNQPLSFHCNGPVCFGMRNNFGALNASLTCSSLRDPFQV